MGVACLVIAFAVGFVTYGECFFPLPCSASFIFRERFGVTSNWLFVGKVDFGPSLGVGRRLVLIVIGRSGFCRRTVAC